MYGTQTFYCPALVLNSFENDVKMYGTQTPSSYAKGFLRLRMM